MNIKFFNYQITESLPAIDFNKKIVVNTMNAHSFSCALKDKKFRAALEQSDFLTPDGVGVTLALKLLKNLNVKKFAGWDTHGFYLNQANEMSLKVFYMGASEKTLSKIEKKINLKFPNIKIETYSPPYKDVLSSDDNEIIIEKINKFQPHILFVGMTSVKQEKWVFENINQISCNVSCSIGAVFDFFAENPKRAGKIWIYLHLEWLERFLKSPKRMFGRIFISTPKFLFFLITNRKKI